MSHVENDRVADVFEAPSTSVILKEKCNLDIPLDENKQNWIDKKGNRRLISEKTLLLHVKSVIHNLVKKFPLNQLML